MSIDREINQRVEAYGNNPGALKKRYAASKQLIDLLALQRLKSQKDAAARKIQMEMEQMPGTIKAQREQELMGQNVQDLTKRTADTMRNMAQKKQMKAQNKAMAERAKGLASLAGNPQMAMAQQNRPQQPQRMQAGGIVALKKGGLSESNDDDVRKEIQRLINMGYSDEEIKGMLSKTPEEVIKSVRRQQQEDMRASGRGVPAEKGRDIPAGREFDEPKKVKPKKPEGAVERLFGEQGAILPLGLTKESGTRDRVQYAIDTNKPLSNFSTEQLQSLRSDGDQYTPKIEAELARRKSQAPEKPEGIAAVAEQPKKPVEVPPEAKPKPEEVVAEEAGMEEKIPDTAIQRVKGGQAQPVPQLKPETISTEGTFDLSKEMLKEAGLDPAAIDPDKAGITARDDTMKYLSEVVRPDGTKTTKDAEMRERLAGLEALDKAQRDPRKLRQERLMARLIAGSQGGLGSAAAGGARAAQSQGRALRDRELQRMELLGQIQDRDSTLRLNATKAQQEAFAEHSANKRTAVNALATGSAAEIRRRTAEAQMKMEANQGNIANKLKRLEIDAIDADRRLRATEGSIEDTQGLLADTVRRLGEARAEFVNADENYIAAQREANLVLQDSDSSEEERNAATKRKQDARSAAVLAFESAMGQQYPQLTGLIESLEADLVSLKARRRGFSDPQAASTPVTLSSSKASDAYARNIGG